MLIEMRGPSDSGGPGLDYGLIADALRQARGQWICLTFTGSESSLLERLAADAERSFARLSEGMANAVFAGAEASDRTSEAVEPAAFEMRFASPSLYIRWRSEEEGNPAASDPAMPGEAAEQGSEEAVNLS